MMRIGPSAHQVEKDAVRLISFRDRAPWWGGDLQTLRNHLLPPREPLPAITAARTFKTSDGSGDRLLAQLDTPPNPAATSPLVVLIHGLTGCEESTYVRRTAKFHLLRGRTVLRLNLRGAGPSRAMAKGHYHAVERTAEVYHCLSGRGVILMEMRGGDAAEEFLEPGQAVYIPPGWAHRSVNVGDEPFIFFYAMPGGAGHDYEAFEGKGFRRIVVERDGGPAVLPNPQRRTT